MNSKTNRSGGGVTDKSHLARALGELTTEQKTLTARLGKLDSAIDALRTLCDVFHVPTERPASKVRAMAPSPRTNGSGKPDKAKDAIRSALANGPLTTRALAAKVGLKCPALLYHTSQMKKAGVLVTTGASSSTRYALAGKPAKEAP